MKKSFLITLVYVISFTLAFAQKPVVQDAFQYLRKKDYAEAKKSIDQAVKDPETINYFKAWFYRGNIYFQIYVNKDSNVRKLEPNALAISSESYVKAYEIEKDNEDAKSGIYQNAIAYFNEGVKYFKLKKYETAYQNYQKSIPLFTIYDRDKYMPFALENSAICAKVSGHNDIAKINYIKLIEIKPENDKPYFNLIDIYLGENDTINAKNIISKAKKLFPDSVNTIIYEINYYLHINKTPEAQALLKKAIERLPNNILLYLAAGSNYEKTINDPAKKQEERDAAFVEAENTYIKANSVKADNFDVKKRLGALYFNYAIDIQTIASNLPLDKDELTKKENARAKDYFMKALPYFEEATKLNEKDAQVLASLKSIYLRTGQKENAAKIDEKIKALAPAKK